MKDRRYFKDKVCSIENCDRPCWARGWCGTHYHLWRRWGDPNKRYKLGLKCSVLECDEPSRVKGWCDKHYRQITWATDLEKREARKARNKRYREQNLDKAKKWYKNGLPNHIAHNKNRVAMMKGTPGTYDSEAIKQRILYFGARCWIKGPHCNGKFEHVDHVKPLNKGGSNWASNLRPSCQPCNTGKSDTWPYPVQSRKFVKNKLP